MTSDNSQLILGYQLRAPTKRIAAQWTAERRAQYLLKPSIASPLSADTSVWPVVEDSALASAIFDDFELGSFEAPNGLSLFRLKRNSDKKIASLLNGGEVVVAIGASRDVADRLSEKHKIERSSPAGKQAEQRAELLGFDVCDEWLLSGLMNCGIGTSNLEKLRLKYSDLINDSGLFKDIAAATKYSAELDMIVPEHAPFFPISLYTVHS